MTADSGEFQQVTSERDLAKLLEDIRLVVQEISGQANGEHHFKLRVRTVDKDSVLTSVIAQADGSTGLPADGSPVELIFGTADGSYLVRTTARIKARDELVFALGKEVFRLQRRNNFRTGVPVGMKISYRLSAFRNQVLPAPIVVGLVDLSAGGMRLNWPSKGVGAPKEGDHVTGTLQLLNGKTLELFGLVKTLLPQTDQAKPDPVMHVGIEFQNASLRDEQTLLFAVVQVQREFASRR